jgi:hypothetical protein
MTLLSRWVLILYIHILRVDTQGYFSLYGKFLLFLRFSSEGLYGVPWCERCHSQGPRTLSAGLPPHCSESDLALSAHEVVLSREKSLKMSYLSLIPSPCSLGRLRHSCPATAMCTNVPSSPSDTGFRHYFSLRQKFFYFQVSPSLKSLSLSSPVVG